MILEKLNHSLCMAQQKESPYETVIAVDHCSGLRSCHLYMVTLTRRNVKECCSPTVSIYYCIAPDEKEAISQVESNAYPELTGLLEDEYRKDLVSSAVQIPLHIRGWGSQTF